MRKLAILTIIFAVAAVFSGCTQIAMGRSEIDKLFVVRIISFDETKEDKIKITISTKTISTGDGGGGGAAPKGESISAEGETVFDAVRNLTMYSDRKPNYGHTEFILFSEPVARNGILRYLDFIGRHNEFRYNAKIYIVKADSVSSFLKSANTSKLFAGDRIANIENNFGKTSLASITTLNEALMIFDERHLDTFIPFIEPIPSKILDEKPGTNDILIKGYAIFRADKLLYYTLPEEARGINWLMNRISSGIIVVKDKRGQEISLEIKKGSSKLIPSVEEGELRCAVEVSFTTNIGEIMGGQSIFNKEDLDFLTEQQEKAVKQEVEKTIRLAQEKNSDHFSTISRFIMKYPALGDYFQDNWSKLFPDIKFEVSVDSKINATYMINEPVSASKEAVGE